MSNILISTLPTTAPTRTTPLVANATGTFAGPTVAQVVSLTQHTDIADFTAGVLAVLSALPTNPTGLAVGAWWIDAGTLKQVQP